MKESKKFLDTLQKLGEKWNISAALLLQEADGEQLSFCHGHADHAGKRPLTLEERYCFSARDYFFQALCLWRLADEKKIRFSDKISKFLPEYRHADRITIAHLLRSESGIENEFAHVRMANLQKDPVHMALSEEAQFQKEYEVRTADISFAQAMDMIGQDELTHEPGKDNDGSNTAVIFLDEIIRRISGLSAREYLLQNIFAPLGLKDTVPGNESTVEIRGCMKDDVIVPLPKLAPAHAFTTTLSDMNLLARAIVSGDFFSEKVLSAARKCNQYGCGLGIMKVGPTYIADTFPEVMGSYFRMYLNFEEKSSLVLLNAEEFISRRENDQWMAFAPEMRRNWQDQGIYPKEPKLKRVNKNNVWDAMDIRISEAQHSFVPDAKTCIAGTLAACQPVYVLMDHNTPIGIAALKIEPKKNLYDIAFLQVDQRFQGRGYGRIMLLKTMEILKEKGAKTLEIGVNRYNEAAKRLYMSVGFEPDQVYEGFINLKMKL